MSTKEHKKWLEDVNRRNATLGRQKIQLLENLKKEIKGVKCLTPEEIIDIKIKAIKFAYGVKDDKR